MRRNRTAQFRTRLAVELLERRQLLAGNVSAFLDARGSLMIVGDSAANCVELDQSGAFTVRGCDAGGRPTRINGVSNGEVALNARPGANVTIRLNAGHDVLRVGFNSDSVNVAGDLQIDAGAGNDLLTVTGDTNVGDDLKIVAGGGNDAVNVFNANVADQVSIDSGSGHDVVLLLFGQYGGTTAINTGAGNDYLRTDAVHYEGRFGVKTGANDDFVEVRDSTFERAVDIALDHGNDRLCVGGETSEGSIFNHRDVEFHGGAGRNDRYVIENSEFAGDPLLGDLVDGFEFEVDDCSDLGDPPINDLSTNIVVRATTYRDCSDVPLVPGADLRRCDMRPLPLAGKNVTGADMTRANLAGMNLDIGPDDPRGNLTDVRLHRAQLTGTSFSNTILNGADLTRATAPNTQYEDTVLASADFSRTDLRGASFFNSFGDGARFHRANLEGGELRGASFKEADFSRAILRDVDARGTDLRDADLSRADLTGADLTGADLTGARLDNAIGLDSVTWSNTTCPDGTNSDTHGGTCIGHL